MKKSLLFAAMMTLPLSMSQVQAADLSSTKSKKSATNLPAGVSEEKMQQMHDQVHKIMETKNPQDRQSLMQELAKMLNDNGAPQINGRNTGKETTGSSGAPILPEGEIDAASMGGGGGGGGGGHMGGGGGM